MRRARLGGLDTVIVGEGDGPAVVLLHGFGAPGEDLVPLARMLDAPPGTRFVFPVGPIELGLPFSEARAWWMIDISRFERDSLIICFVRLVHWRAPRRPGQVCCR